jgi:hypothetical protein
MIAGLLFLPLLPLLLSIGFGTWTRKWKLVSQAAISFAVAIGLLIFAGLLVGTLSEPPVKYDEFSSLTVSFLISLAVGTAAGLSTIDDVARRELIGLAASSQIALIPAWMGVCMVLGFPATTGSSEISDHVLSVLINIVTIIVSSVTVYITVYGFSPSLAKVLNLQKTERNISVNRDQRNLRVDQLGGPKIS